MAEMLAKIGVAVHILALVDNTQAILAVERGYSKKLRHLERTHRCSIAVLNELWVSGDISLQYAQTDSHKGDGFTKALLPAKFVAARQLMGIEVGPV